jgi:hypothetical protein
LDSKFTYDKRKEYFKYRKQNDLPGSKPVGQALMVTFHVSVTEPVIEAKTG